MTSSRREQIMALSNYLNTRTQPPKSEAANSSKGPATQAKAPPLAKPSLVKPVPSARRPLHVLPNSTKNTEIRANSGTLTLAKPSAPAPVPSEPSPTANPASTTAQPTPFRKRYNTAAKNLATRLKAVGAPWPVVLQQTWKHEPKPLAIGIDQQVFALFPDEGSEEDKTAVRKLLHLLCRSKSYKIALAVPNAMRHGLDGQPIEPVSDENQSGAKAAFNLPARKVQEGG